MPGFAILVSEKIFAKTNTIPLRGLAAHPETSHADSPKHIQLTITMTNLFTYGSLMCSDIMAKVAGCQNDCTQASLHNFFRAKMRNEEYPGIMPQPDTKVLGVLYVNLTAVALHRLDLFEGEMYQRQEVEVVTETNRLTPAMTYVIKPQYRHLLSDKEWDFSEFLSAGKEKFEKSYIGFWQFGAPTD